MYESDYGNLSYDEDDTIIAPLVNSKQAYYSGTREYMANADPTLTTTTTTTSSGFYPGLDLNNSGIMTFGDQQIVTKQDQLHSATTPNRDESDNDITEITITTPTVTQGSGSSFTQNAQGSYTITTTTPPPPPPPFTPATPQVPQRDQQEEALKKARASMIKANAEANMYRLERDELKKQVFSMNLQLESLSALYDQLNNNDEKEKEKNTISPSSQNSDATIYALERSRYEASLSRDAFRVSFAMLLKISDYLVENAHSISTTYRGMKLMEENGQMTTAGMLPVNIVGQYDKKEMSILSLRSGDEIRRTDIGKLTEDYKKVLLTNCKIERRPNETVTRCPVYGLASNDSEIKMHYEYRLYNPQVKFPDNYDTILGRSTGGAEIAIKLSRTGDKAGIVASAGQKIMPVCGEYYYGSRKSSTVFERELVEESRGRLVNRKSTLHHTEMINPMGRMAVHRVYKESNVESSVVVYYGKYSNEAFFLLPSKHPNTRIVYDDATQFFWVEARRNINSGDILTVDHTETLEGLVYMKNKSSILVDDYAYTGPEIQL